MKKILLVLLCLVVVYSMILSGCSPNTTQEPTGSGESAQQGGTEETIQKGGTVRYAAFGAAPGVFNPVLQSNSFDIYEMEVMFEGLLKKNLENQLEPCLAESFSISEDNKTVTYKLRDGVKWHDGQPLTVEDVQFTFEFIGHPDYPGPYGSTVQPIKGAAAYKNGETQHIEGIQIIDPLTISITTDEVKATSLELITTTVRIIPKHIWEKVDIKKSLEATELLRHPVGTGPFKMGKFVPDQYVEMVANDDYWNGRPIIDKYIIQVSNPETAQSQIINGEIDMLAVKQMNSDDLDYYKSNGIEVKEISFDAAMGLGVNNAMEIFNDKKVRQAFAYAIDREAIVRDILYGYGSVANIPYKVWDIPNGINEYKYNPDKAIELLKEAGWEYRENEKQMYKNGKPVKFTLKYYSGNKQVENIAPFIQQSLKNIGIQIDLQIAEYSTMLTEIKKGEFELYIMAQKNGVAGDMEALIHTDRVPPKGTNYTHFSNQKIDELSTKGLQYLTTEERQPIYHELSLLLNEEIPIIYLYHWSQGIAINGKLKGVHTTHNSQLGINYGVEKWYLEK